MSNWKKAHRSFYYKNAEDPEDIILHKKETALLVIDIRNAIVISPHPAAQSCSYEAVQKLIH